jgi:hypothetical protein
VTSMEPIIRDSCLMPSLGASRSSFILCTLGSRWPRGGVNCANIKLSQKLKTYHLAHFTLCA